MPPQPAAGGSNTGESVYCFNPCLEAPFGPSILPNSLPGSTKKGSKLVKTANNVGSHTNCMSCHEMAKFPAPDTLSYTGDRYVDINDTMVDSGSSPVVANPIGRVTKSHPTRTPPDPVSAASAVCASGQDLSASYRALARTQSRTVNYYFLAHWMQVDLAAAKNCGLVSLMRRYSPLTDEHLTAYVRNMLAVASAIRPTRTNERMNLVS